MSLKDRYVDVRYHMKEQSTVKHKPNTPRCFGYFASKRDYVFPRTFDVEFKPKYRMKC